MSGSHRIADNLARLRERMAAAAVRCGRQPGQIRLIAVTKYVDADLTRALVEAGCHDLGESRPQQLWDKAPLLADLPICWHLIGPLQRNKVKRTLPLVSMIHSLDSLRLLQAVAASAAQLGLRRDALLEVNCSEEAAKHGFREAELPQALEAAAVLGQLQIRGLMTMASREGGPLQARRDFARLRGVRDQLLDQCPPNIQLEELSMGMSGDFEEAIEEGATMVRIGSALFE